MPIHQVNIAETFLFISAVVSLLCPDALETVTMGQFFLYGILNFICSFEDEAEIRKSE